MAVNQKNETLETKLNTLNGKFDMLLKKLDDKFDHIDQRFDGIDKRFSSIDQRFDGIDSKLREHDTLFSNIGDAYVKLSYKLDVVIKQTSEIPLMRDDIAYLKIKAAQNENNISKISDQLFKMEAKDDYLLSRIEKLDERMGNIEAREYA